MNTVVRMPNIELLWYVNILYLIDDQKLQAKLKVNSQFEMCQNSSGTHTGHDIYVIISKNTRNSSYNQVIYDKNTLK
jgi:hypothetical protein